VTRTLDRTAALSLAEETRPFYGECRYTPSAYRYPDGTAVLEGVVLECSPPSRLVTTYLARWAPDVSEDPASRVTYAIEPMGAVDLAEVIHDPKCAPGR